MTALDQSFIQLLTALGHLVVDLGRVLVPLIPLIIWIAFWTLAVNWTKLRLVLLQGGWIGLALIGDRLRPRVGDRGPATHRIASSARSDARKLRRQNGVCDDAGLHHVPVRLGSAFRRVRPAVPIRRASGRA